MSPSGVLTANDLERLEAVLVELNQAAARAILARFRVDGAVENKKPGAGSYDPVTAADREAEAAIRAILAERYPDHGVIGEEYGEDRPGADFVWVLDPIDGTRAFVAGLPVWTTLIGLRHEGVPVLGSIGQPYLGELFVGDSVRGSRLVSRGTTRKLAVRRGVPLAEAVLATTDPEGCFDDVERRAWTALRGAARLARTGCDAYAYAMVASGTVDLVVESGLSPWDIEAAVPIIAGAGGLVTDWRGQPLRIGGGQVAIAGDREVLGRALGLLTPAARR